MKHCIKTYFNFNLVGSNCIYRIVKVTGSCKVLTKRMTLQKVCIHFCNKPLGISFLGQNFRRGALWACNQRRFYLDGKGLHNVYEADLWRHCFHALQGGSAFRFKGIYTSIFIKYVVYILKSSWFLAAKHEKVCNRKILLLVFVWELRMIVRFWQMTIFIKNADNR